MESTLQAACWVIFCMLHMACILLLPGFVLVVGPDSLFGTLLLRACVPVGCI